MKFMKKSGVAICGAFAMTILLLCGFTFSRAYTMKSTEKTLPNPNDNNARYHNNRFQNETTSMKTANVLGET